MNKLPIACAALSLSLLIVPGAFAQGVATPALKQYGKTITVSTPIVVESGQTFDGGLPNGKWTRFVADPKKLGDGGQSENQKPIFILKPGATLTRVILDKPSADGIHMEGRAGVTTKIVDIQVRDVGEDAITISRGDNEKASFNITRSSFLKASDKVIQVNAPGTLVIQNCYAQKFGRFIRTCGTCGDKPYTLFINNLSARDGDTVLKMSTPKARATFTNINYTNVKSVTDLSGGAKANVNGVKEQKTGGLFGGDGIFDGDGDGLFDGNGPLFGENGIFR